MVAYTFDPARVAGIISSMRKDARVLIVARTQESGADIMRGILDARVLQVDKMNGRRGREHVTLAGGGTIRIASSRGRGARGQTAHLAILEAGVGDDALRDAQLATLTTRGALVWVKATNTPEEAHEPAHGEPEPPNTDPGPEGAEENPDPPTT